MTASISRRDRRTLVVGSTVLGVLFSVARGIPALQAWRAHHAASVVTLRQRVAFARTARRLLPSMRDSIAIGRRQLAELNAHVVEAPTSSVAVATLGALIERIADGAHVKINALELRSDSLARPPITRVTVRLTGEGDVVGVGSFLSAIDRHDEPMVVRELNVSQSDPVSPDDRAEVLHFDVRVEGLALLSDRARSETAPDARPVEASIVPSFAEGDPFRLANRPAIVRYGSAPPASDRGVIAAPRDPRPTMTVRAIAGGPPWHALIDGMPGQSHPTLVRAGTKVERLTVRSINRDSVVLRDADTTLVLIFARRR